MGLSHQEPSSLSVGGTQQCGSHINPQRLSRQKNRRVPGKLSPPNLIISGPLAQLAHSRESNIRAKWGQPPSEAGAPQVPDDKAWGSASDPLVRSQWGVSPPGAPTRTPAARPESYTRGRAPMRTTGPATRAPLGAGRSGSPTRVAGCAPPCTYLPSAQAQGGHLGAVVELQMAGHDCHALHTLTDNCAALARARTFK